MRGEEEGYEAADGVWEATSAEEKVKILASLESAVPDKGGVAVIVLGYLISMRPGRGDIACAVRGVSGY